AADNAFIAWRYTDGNAAGSAPLTIPANAAPGAYELRLFSNNVYTLLATSNRFSIGSSSATMKLHFIHVDHLDTPRLIADSSGTPVWRNDNTEPFGSSAPGENPVGLGAFEFPLRFPGQYADKETNLHYNYFRDYDPSLGRYGESDPIGFRGGLNTYAYVASSPLSYKDVLGLLPMEIMGKGRSLLDEPPVATPKCEEMCLFEVKPDCRPGDTQCAMASAAAGLSMST